MMFDCAICGKRISKSLICRKCQQDYDLDQEWAKRLITLETRWRNMERRDLRHGVVCLTEYRGFMDGEEYDGWDVLDGEIAGTDGPLLNALGSNDHYFAPDPEAALFRLQHLFYHLAEEADLTEGEFYALGFAVFAGGETPLSSKRGAELLSNQEGKEVSAAAFRRRLADARQKAREVVKSPTYFALRQLYRGWE